PDLRDIWRLGTQQAQSRPGVSDCRRDGLHDLVGNRGCELPHGRYAIDVGEFPLRLPQATLARSLSWARFCSVKSSTNATPSFPPPSKSAPPSSTGTRLPSFRKYSFSNGWKIPDAFNSATPCSSWPRHSAGVRSVQRTRPVMIEASG